MSASTAGPEAPHNGCSALQRSSRAPRATVADEASSLVVVQVRFGEEAWRAATAAAALINTARPFGRQRLPSHNEFPSGAADLNVSQRQFELGCDDVWADKQTVCVLFYLG